MREQNLRTGQITIVGGSAITLLGGLMKAAAPFAVAGGGGPEDPIGDAAAKALLWAGDKSEEIGGGIAGGGAVLLAANGQLREGINQIIEYPIDAGLHMIAPEPMSEVIIQEIDFGLNKIEDRLQVPKDQSPKPHI